MDKITRREATGPQRSKGSTAQWSMRVAQQQAAGLSRLWGWGTWGKAAREAVCCLSLLRIWYSSSVVRMLFFFLCWHWLIFFYILSDGVVDGGRWMASPGAREIARMTEECCSAYRAFLWALLHGSVVLPPFLASWAGLSTLSCTVVPYIWYKCLKYSTSFFFFLFAHVLVR